MTPDRKLQKEISPLREKSSEKRKRFNWVEPTDRDLRFSPSRSQKLGSPFGIIEGWATRTLKGRFKWTDTNVSTSSIARTRLNARSSTRFGAMTVRQSGLKEPLATQKRPLGTNRRSIVSSHNSNIGVLPTPGLI